MQNTYFGFCASALGIVNDKNWIKSIDKKDEERRRKERKKEEKKEKEEEKN